MDRAMALERLGLASQDWGPRVAEAFTHAEFSESWRGSVPCPTDADLQAAYTAAVAALPDQAEQRCRDALNDAGANINLLKLAKAKFISDLAFRLGKAPGALTGAELTAERNRIAAIYKTL